MKKLTFNLNTGTDSYFSSVIKLTKEQAIQLGIDPNEEEQRGELKTRGPWNIPISYQAVCISAVYNRESYPIKCLSKTVYGLRKMSNMRESGYSAEGRVSVNGKKYTCFTSSQLFEVDGKLLNVATIHARIK
jgi:hypothetical protein